MILIDNFKKINDWPAIGFLYGQDILDKTVFDTLLEFDFNCCPITDPAFPNRKSITTDNASSINDQLAITLDNLKQFTNNFNIIETLVVRSLENSGMRLENFWTHELQSIKQLQKNVHIQFVEDKPGLNMAPHVDHREVLCNIQIYISPDLPDIGTTFYQAGDFTKFKTAPFVSNSGYFLLNTHLSFHGMNNTSAQNRKSIILSWTM